MRGLLTLGKLLTIDLQNEGVALLVCSLLLDIFWKSFADSTFKSLAFVPVVLVVERGNGNGSQTFSIEFDLIRSSESATTWVRLIFKRFKRSKFKSINLFNSVLLIVLCMLGRGANGLLKDTLLAVVDVEDPDEKVDAGVDGIWIEHDWFDL